MIPKSNQSPDDIETKVMALNAAGNAYEPQWRDIQIVRQVAARRYEALVAQHVEHHYPLPDNEQQCRDFLAGKITLDQATQLDGDDVDAKADAALRGVRSIDARQKIDAIRVATLAEIGTSDDPDECIALSVNEQPLCNAFVDDECAACNEYLSVVPDANLVRSVFQNLGSTCGTDALRKTVDTFGLETDITTTVFNGMLGDKLLLARPDMVSVVGIDHTPTALDRIGRAVHCLWVPQDRTGTLPASLKMEAPAIPTGSTSETFEQIADARAVALWAENQHLKVYWSGGIDSTVALTALMRNAPADAADRLTVFYTAGSIVEYPAFYQMHIDGKLNAVEVTQPLKPSDRYWAENIFHSAVCEHIASQIGDGLVVTGELGDQVFGSAGFANDPTRINGDLEEFLADFSDIRDEIDALSAACPVPVNNIVTLMWWWNFSTKWSEVKYRSLTCVSDAAHLANARHFFDTDDFQRWSMSNDDKRIRNTAESYKWPAKDYIYDWTGDSFYRDNKLKEGSLRVRWGPPLGIDNAGNIISAGQTSTSEALIQQRYSDALRRFAA